jgi:hypothetical protein
LFRNISTELKTRLDTNIEFSLRCIENFCRGLKTRTKELPMEEYEGVAKYLNQLTSIEKIRSSRLAKMRSQGQSKGSSMRGGKGGESQFKELFNLFPKFRETHEEYLQESRELRENDVVDLLSKWNIHDQLFLDNHTLKWCLHFLLEEKTHWEQNLQCLGAINDSLFRTLSKGYTSMLRTVFHRTQKQRYAKFVRDRTVQVQDFQEAPPKQAKTSKIEKNKPHLNAYLRRLFGEYPFCVKNQTLEREVSWVPVLDQQTLKKQSTSSVSGNRRMSSFNKIVNLETLYTSETQTQEKRHLIVLLHGHNGHRKNMHLYRRFIGMILPRAICLPAKSLSNSKTGCIRTMAKDLVNEIVFMLKRHGAIQHISFICHNLGGVVARAALPFLEPFKLHMHTFLSMGTPHLGKGHASSFFDKSKFFFWEDLTSTTVKSQLEMKDTEDVRESLLYSMAKEDCLHWFENIILVDSKEHTEVDTESAHIHTWTADVDPSTQKVLKEMTQFIWGASNHHSIVRVDANLDDPNRYFTHFLFLGSTFFLIFLFSNFE